MDDVTQFRIVHGYLTEQLKKYLSCLYCERNMNDAVLIPKPLVTIRITT